jgi:heat shock protein HtpX
MDYEFQARTRSHRVSNVLKTTVLLAALSALMLAVGHWVGGPRGLVWAGAFVLAMNFASYWFSDALALAMNGAKPLEPGQAPLLEQLTAQLAHRAGLPMPRLYVIHSHAPNAFATGRNPANAAIAVTTGLLERLQPRELAGVLAHELAHVKNRDTLIMTVAATLAGVITQVAHWVFWWGGAALGRSDDDDGAPNALASLGLLLVAPLSATLLQLAISRSREYDADAAAAELTQDPRGLASALARLDEAKDAFHLTTNPATAHLFIVNPLSGGAVLSLFSTHPPVERRIERLLAMER